MNPPQAITVLVHGLWLHGMTMEVQRLYLARMGFEATCYSYPSVRYSLTENAERLARFAHGVTAPVVHWVGHSLGGIIILRLLEREVGLPLGRVVLLGVPCGGSYAGRALAASGIGSRMLGRCVREWLAAPGHGSFARREIGVVAGNTGVGLGRFVARGLRMPHDGTITVEETQLAGACDHIVMATSHTAMLFSRPVARQTAAFLRDGHFDHGVDSA